MDNNPLTRPIYSKNEAIAMRLYTPGSFTKNFSWDRSFERLYRSVRSGFAGRAEPRSREQWREASGIRDRDRQLIPMNFFLYNWSGVDDDYLLVDQFVRTALTGAYSLEFAKLSLFVFHLANSGKWRRSTRGDGRVAGWANDYILEISSDKGTWAPGAFDEERLASFLDDRVDAEPETKRKMLTNYRYMLVSAGVLRDGKLTEPDLRQRWYVDAVQLVWDRLIFGGALSATSGASDFEYALYSNSVHKLLRCSRDQCEAFARAALPEYEPTSKLIQINDLQRRGLVA